MLRIAICDDIYDARLQLRANLERLLELREMEAVFFEFSAGENLLRWMQTHSGEVDLIFLDMKMGELDGMETHGSSGRRMPWYSWCLSRAMRTASLMDIRSAPWAI